MGGKLRAISVSLCANIFLVSVEFIVSVMTGSLSVLSDAFHSVVDLSASCVALLGIRAAEAPLSEEKETHVYGHERYENISSLIQGILIGIIAVFVVVEACRRLLFGFHVFSSPLMVTIIIFTLLVDIGVYRYQLKMSRRYRSAVLEADAYHFSTDALAKVGVIVGLVFVYLSFKIMDILVSFLLAALMVYVGYIVAKKAVDVLTDSLPSHEMLDKLISIALAVEGVEEAHRMRARRSGSAILADVHIIVNPSLTVKEAHEIAHEVESRIKEGIPDVREIVVHIEPHE